jgi:parallel beta-helix repeat protein
MTLVALRRRWEGWEITGARPSTRATRGINGGAKEQIMIRRRWKVALVTSAATGVVLFLSPAAGAASAYHVDGDSPVCTDSGPGSADQPFCRISRGASIAQAGDTVIVHGATYPETVTVPRSGASGAPIVFEAAPGEVPTVTGGTYGFRLSGRHWITIRGFVVADTDKHGIYATTGNQLTISGNEVSGAGQPISGEIAKGIYLKATSNSLLEGNSVHHNSDHGILLGGGTTGTTVRGNVSFHNARQFTRAAAGIHVAGSSGNVIEANLTYANEDTGINVRSGANNNLVVRNASRNNGDHGFDTLKAIGTRYVANTAFGNRMDGLSVEGTSTGTLIANCISADNGRFELFVDAGSATGFTADYDLLWDPDSASDVKYAGTSYSTVAKFADATPHEDHGLGADPMFVNPAERDLHLQAGSPAIDSADSGVSGHPPVDLEGKPRVDDPAVTNTGAGPRPYDDRGAYERQLA